mgnify:CR=1 FL=1
MKEINQLGHCVMIQNLSFNFHYWTIRASCKLHWHNCGVSSLVSPRTIGDNDKTRFCSASFWPMVQTEVRSNVSPHIHRGTKFIESRGGVVARTKEPTAKETRGRKKEGQFVVGRRRDRTRDPALFVLGTLIPVEWRMVWGRRRSKWRLVPFLPPRVCRCLFSLRSSRLSHTCSLEASSPELRPSLCFAPSFEGKRK